MFLEEHIPATDPDLKELILKIADQGMVIRAGFQSRQDACDTTNVYGETQVQMDVFADEVIVEALGKLDCVNSVASEERPDIVSLNEGGAFSVTMDPLDGSSLMGVNLTVGTIIGIYRNSSPFNPGKEMVGALYSLYGPLTTLTYTIGEGVHEFVLDEEGSYKLQHEGIRIGSSRLYAPGALRKKWLPPHRRFIQKLESEGYKLRFSGSFVADVHQILHKGGVFTYPAFEGSENGKLRLLFEANPMGFIITQAGGAASNGRGNILDMDPDKLDQRVPVYIGGKSEISMIEEEMLR